MTLSMATMLLEQRKNLETQARAILETAETEKRDLTAEESGQFDRINADMTALRSRSDQLVQFAADSQATEEQLRKAGHTGHQEQRGGSSDVGTQLRNLLSGKVSHVEFAPTRDELRALTNPERRALGKASATAGGNTVPTTFYAQLVEHLVEASSILLAGANVLTTASGEEIQVPVTTSHGTAARVTEGSAIGGTDPAFGKRSLLSYKYGELIEVPRELADDTGVDLEGYLARQGGNAVGNAFGADLVVGTGSSMPAGITTLTTLGKTSATTVGGAPTFDDVIDLFYSVNGLYRNSAQAGWLIKDSTAGALRKLKDSSGRYLWESSVVAGQPDLILSKPVTTDPYMPAIGLNNKAIVFGDIYRYWARIVNGVRFERSDEFGFNKDVITYRVIVRGDGMLMDQSGAVKHFVGAAT